MTFADKTYADRIADPMFYHSENFFEKLWPGPWERYGLGEASAGMASYKYAPFISHTPDYRAALNGTSEPFLVEVQGTGTKAEVRTHKFKQKKLDQLAKWNSMSEVTFWLWDDKTQTSVWMSYAKLRMLIAQGKGTQGLFDGHRPYWAIPVDTIIEEADTDRLEARYG